MTLLDDVNGLNVPPVLFIAFNRPDTTSLVFNAIRDARPSKLYVAVDGPRAGLEGEFEKVARVRKIATSVDWPCELKTLIRETNLGCKYAVSGAISWFFDNEDSGIILEDDCLPDLSFFGFCQEMLVKYRNDTRVLMVSGTNLAWDINGKEGYYFSRYPHIWGWASWRRAWKSYDVDMNDLPQLLKDKNFISSFKSKSEYRYWAHYFLDVYTGRINTWDIQVVYLALTQGQLTIFPSGNLVSNIGFGVDATHTSKINRKIANLPIIPLGSNAIQPTFMIPNIVFESRRKHKESIGKRNISQLFRSVVRKVRNLILLILIN